MPVAGAGAPARDVRRRSSPYELTDDAKNPTAIAVQKNFVTALQKIGAKLVHLHGAGNEGSTGSYTPTTIEVGGPPPKGCKLEIYGAHFDTDKAMLRPDSEQVLAMFQKQPSAPTRSWTRLPRDAAARAEHERREPREEPPRRARPQRFQ